MENLKWSMTKIRKKSQKHDEIWLWNSCLNEFTHVHRHVPMHMMIENVAICNVKSSTTARSNSPHTASLPDQSLHLYVYSQPNPVYIESHWDFLPNDDSCNILQSTHF